MSGTNGALAAGEKIQVSSDGVTWHDVTQAGTSWSYDDTANPHGSSFTYTARIVDTAGNIGSTTSQAITIDTTAPGVTFDTVSFTDTGVQGDHITANGQVTLSGTVSDNVTVSQVQVFNGSQLLGTATVDNVHHIWTLTTTLAPGAYNQFNATATDEAGNSANATTTQTVQVNDAPVLTPISPTLTAITEDQTSNVSDPGQTVSSFIGASISDVDAGAVKGIAITGLSSTNGSWQYSIDGGTTWIAVGAVSNSTALLLDASDKIRFLPDGNNGGSDSITYRAWDETAGSHGTTADTSANGGTTAFSTATDTAHLTVASVNDAPVLTPISPTLTAITEDQTSNVSDPGQTVSSFIGASIRDVDAGAVKGIAITGLSSTNGSWQYSIDGGTTWIAVGAVSNSTALLLDASDKIRFLPDGNNGGSDSITYRAWDETAGSHGTTADTSANGGTTAFSTATDTAHLTVASVNDAPVLTPISPTLTAITEDQTSNVSDPGQTVSSFIGASIRDVDAGAVKGIAITGLSSTNGSWQYSIDGGTTWIAVGAVSNSTALLLDASDKIRFLPDGNNGGSDSITYRAWDETTGSHGTTADTSANGGTTAFSTATDTAHLTVTSVNDAPVATITPTTYSATEQTSLSLKNNGLAVSDVDSLGGVEKVTLSVTEGTLTVTAGTSGATVSGSGSKSVAITGTLAQINALLNTDGTSTVSYFDNTYNPSPSAALALSINDNGNTGSGGALTGSDTATINITPVVSAATYKTFNGSTQNNLTEIDTNGGSVRITLTFSGAVHFSGGNPTLLIADGDEVPPGSDDDVATYNASLSDPTHGVLVFTTTADSDGLTHDLAIIAVNGTIRDANNVNVNTAPFIGVLSNHVLLNGTIVQQHLGLNEPAAPAGIAGEPINLALTDPSGGQSGPVTVTVTGAPSDWSLDHGTNLGGGIWAVQTSDPAALTIRTPANFAGAALLNVTESWTNADGSTGTASLKDNVEAYAAGSPIFALSGDDFLTASSGKDLLVFSQPIGHDTVYSFDAAHDQLDLIGYAGFTSFADIEAHLADDANGDAVITLGDGQSIELQGVHAVALTENNFVFDQTPTVDNAATMTIGDGAVLPLSGTIVNTGTIALNSTGDETDLQLIEHGVTLEGGGKLLLSDSDANIISGTSSGVTLNNEDNTISGAGQLGNGELTLTNAGTIDATGTHALTIDTGSNLVTNSGVLEASGSGGMMVASGIVNSGVLWANGATLTVQGAVSGNGTATIDGIGTLDFEASTTANVVFGSGTGGTLKLGDSFHFNGTISGFGGSDVIDLANVAAANASISYHENTAGTGGTLAISDGAQTLELSLLGHYSADNFSIVPDPLHGTSITYVPHDLML